MRYALTNCSLLDGREDMTLKRNMTVVVDGQQIAGIYPDSEFNEREIRKINLRGSYLLPGLIDLHVHLPGTGKPVSVSIIPKNDGSDTNPVSKFLAKSLENGVARKVISSIVKQSLTSKLASGVTTVRSMGELCYIDTENRNMINSGKYQGPHLLTSGVGVSVPSGHMAGTMAYICSNEDECINAVNTALDKTADWVKIFVTGGVLDCSENGEPAALRMSQPIADAACRQAHKRGARVASHAESTEGVRVSLKAGVDTIEHGSEMDDEIIELFKKNGSSLTVTISPALAISKLPLKLTGLDENAKEASDFVMNSMIKGAKQALANGIDVGLGTDASCPFVTQYDFWREVYYFHKYCGVSTAFALHTATLKNAQILGLGDKTGSIEAGKDADMIVLENNPLDDLTALRDVKNVIIGGEFVNDMKIKRITSIDKELDKIM